MDFKEICVYAAEGNLQMVKECIKDFGSSISTKYRGKALFYAAANGHLEIVKTIIQQYGETIPQFERVSAFTYATTKGYSEIIETIIGRFGSGIPERNQGVALEVAASTGHEGMAKTLLQRFRDTIPEINRNRAFIEAVEKGHCPIIELIVHLYQDLIPQHTKEEALSIAVERGDAITHDIIKNGSFLQRIENTIEECKKHAPQRVTKLSGIILPFVSHASLEQRKIILEALTTMDPNHPFHIETKEHLKTLHNFYTKTDAQGQDTKTIPIPSAVVERIFKKAEVQIQGIPIHIAAQINKLQNMRVTTKEQTNEAGNAPDILQQHKGLTRE